MVESTGLPSRSFILVCAAFVFCAWCASARAQGEAYYFATGGIDSGPYSFVDRWCGPDMLPYTDDDIELPERGNVGGTWGFSWIDADGDGQLSDEEHIFCIIRRGDDDMQTFSTRSYPQYGVLAEAEDWNDYHEARNRGPSASFLGNIDAEGNDFEHNDRAGAGQTGWEDASNYYWYNNAQANQRGWGGSRYYFEHRNGSGLDEIQGFEKWLSFQHNLDDPNTPFDEKGPCRNSYFRSREAVIKGLLIPIEAIAGLQDGELDPLFGWYSGDMAAYVRDVLGPRLLDPAVKVFESSGGCSQSGLPPTHVMILQIECPIAINPSGDCGDRAAAESQAAYWGIVPIEPGGSETDAVYRVSHILLFNDDLTATGLGVPNFQTEPEDGALLNLWVQDDFWRSDPAKIGRYELGPSRWTIQRDSSFDRGCAEQDMFFQGEPPAYFQAPIAAKLDTSTGRVLAVAEVADALNPAGIAPGGPIAAQLILLEGDRVVAFAEFSEEGSSVAIGGTLDPDGLAERPEKSAQGSPAEIRMLDLTATEFARFVLEAGPEGVRLLQASSGDYTPNRYESLDSYSAIAELRGTSVPGPVDAVRFAAKGGDGSVFVVVDGFAVFSDLPSAAPRGDFIRGDANDDTKVDISDAIFVLGHLFLGGERWVCEEGADINGDDKHDLSDAIYLLNSLFLGGPSVPPPYPDCGPDPGGATCPASRCNAK